jgi:DNA-binding transcriptional ArsR family regulator
MGVRRNLIRSSEDSVCSSETLKKLSTTFKVLGHPARIKIFRVLEGKEYTVSEIQDLIGEVQPVTSQHLKIMADHDLLASRRKGTHVLYSHKSTDFSEKLSSHIVRELMNEANEV